MSLRSKTAGFVAAAALAGAAAAPATAAPVSYRVSAPVAASADAEDGDNIGAIFAFGPLLFTVVAVVGTVVTVVVTTTSP